MLKNSSYKTHSLYQLINDATDNLLRSEDEALNKRICSEILRTSDGPKVAAKIINKIIIKSLSSHCNQSIWYCLLLLDIAVKSTDSRFCSAILAKEFFGDLIKIMDTKYQVPDFVQEKFLYIIKEWHKTLTNVTGYSNLDKFYKIQTSPVIPSNAMSHSVRPYPVELSQHSHIQQIVNPNQVSADKDRIIKDIDIIETNISIFSDTLRTVNSSEMTNEESQFLKELQDSLKIMQERINDILPVLVWEDVTNQLLQINDKINSTLERYVRLMSSRAKKMLVPSNSNIPVYSTFEDIYDKTNVITINENPKHVLNDVYDIPSLPSYNEASSHLTKIKGNQQSKDMNLINFDEDPTHGFYMKQPLPPIPPNSTNDLLTGPIPESSTNQTRMSSDEFDDFIDTIARRHQPQSIDLPEEEYAPPLYDEAKLTKPGHS